MNELAQVLREEIHVKSVIAKGGEENWLKDRLQRLLEFYNTDRIIDYTFIKKDNSYHLDVNLITKVIHWRDGKPSKERIELLKQYEEANT